MIIFSFTKAGTELNRKISRMFAGEPGGCRGYAVKKYIREKEDGQNIMPLPDSVRDMIGEYWGKSAFLFIGAAGIAVRYIAPFVRDKFTDSPVLVADEKGKYIIPLLSGHVGGAAELADRIADRIGGTAVHTTATDVQGKFAVDVFARKNNLHIESRSAAKNISAAVLAGERPGLFVECGDVRILGKIPEEICLCGTREELESREYRIIITDFPGEMSENDEKKELLLIPRRVIAGVGCRRKTAPDVFENGLKSVLEEYQLSAEQLEALASIDLKKDESAILAVSEKYHIPFLTYPADELIKIHDVTSRSEFVEKTTGVDNVCERAARLACPGGKMICGKQKRENMTVSLVRRETILDFTI